MADIPTLTLRARMEIGDLSSPFQGEYQGDNVTTTITTPRHPLDASTIVVTEGSTVLNLNTDYTIDAQDGLILLTNPTPLDEVLSVSGSAYRYFSDTDWQTFFLTALDQHLYNRADEMGQPILLATLPEVEEYPVVLLTITQAMFALLNDASFDIDISTPEGVHIPRGQRVEQLWHMIAGRQEQYNNICGALNVGLWRVETLDLRRVSLTTGRLVPLYQPQEFQDTRFPRQLFPEIPVDNTSVEPVVQFQQIIDLVGYSNQDFSYTVTLDPPVNLTGLSVYGSIRRYPGALTPMIFMTTTVLDPVNGVVTVQVNGRLMYYAGYSKFWDLQTVDAQGNTTTLVGGTFDAIQQGLSGAAQQNITY